MMDWTICRVCDAPGAGLIYDLCEQCLRVCALCGQVGDDDEIQRPEGILGAWCEACREHASPYVG